MGNRNRPTPVFRREAALPGMSRTPPARVHHRSFRALAKLSVIGLNR